jgi:hypothetical protein
MTTCKIPEFPNHVEAAFFLSTKYFDMDGDNNPIPVWIAGERWHACGPTSGEWMGANNFSEFHAFSRINFAR